MRFLLAGSWCRGQARRGESGMRVPVFDSYVGTNAHSLSTLSLPWRGPPLPLRRWSPARFCVSLAGAISVLTLQAGVRRKDRITRVHFVSLE